MAGIADFLDSLIGGFDLMCYSLVIGSLLWGILLQGPWHVVQGKLLLGSDNRVEIDATTILFKKTIQLLYSGALWLAGAQLFKIVLKIWLMTAILERWPFPEFAETTQFIGGITRAALTLVLAAYCYYVLSKNPTSKRYWSIAAWVALPMVISGAWLVHAAGRFENQSVLMFLTVCHQLAAAAWVGGVFHLLNLWRLVKQNKMPFAVWPYFLKHFSVFGLSSVALILITGIPIALQYIDSWNGFIGTGYGNLLMVKIIMLGLALGFAVLNRRATQAYGVNGGQEALIKQVPFYIEVEALLLCALLFTAASLASQPPAIDIANLTASWQEVIHAFAPQLPRISSPTHQALLAGEAGRVAIVGQIPSPAATQWSDYNHNISGLFLTVMSFFAMLSYAKFLPFSRASALQSNVLAHYWPVGFIALGVFLFFRSDAESWPLGPIGFWESTFNNGEVLQHRIATLLVFVLGVIEIRARMRRHAAGYLPYVFPILAAFGGLMLLTHSHIGFQPKSAFLIQVGHTLMGIFSLILASARWLELNLDKPGKNIAGFVSVAALFQIGLILMFYREPLY